MSKVYFHKHGVTNQIANSVGQPHVFEKLADSQGVCELDDVENASNISDLRAWVKKRLGGVTEISAEQYADLKKNLSLELLPPVRPPGEVQVRLFNQENPLDKVAQEQAAQSARLAAGQASAAPAVASSPAASATVQEPSSPKQPRVGKAKKIIPVSAVEAESKAGEGDDVQIRVLSEDGSLPTVAPEIEPVSAPVAPPE